MEKSLKLLVAGNVCGKYTKLFKRVSDVNLKAGPFDLLLCVGDFFGNDIAAYDELINGSTELPNVPCYILGRIPKELLKFHPNVQNFDQGCELVDGITFLGKTGILNTSQGLRIAYLGGMFKEDNKERDDDLEYFTKKEYESLLLSHQSMSSSIVDILVTSQWPKDVFNYVGTDFDQSTIDNINESSSAIISHLCCQLKPRYHFVGGDVNVFYERPPYRNHKVLNETLKNVTRFISIASITNTKKMKWIYAFNVVPSKSLTKQDLVAQPPGVTENPFNKIVQGDEGETSNFPEDQQQNSGQFFYDLNERNDGDRSSRRDNNKRRQYDNNNQERKPKRQMVVDLEKCWFCLASPNVDKTLIVSIGEFSYLALAKGGLTDQHMMILPIEHIRSTVEIEEEGLREEIDKFKKSLGEFFKQRDMVPVFFERNFKSAHFQIQVIGLPESKATSIKEVVSQVFEAFEYHELGSNSELVDVITPGIPYFHFECPGYYNFFVRINTRKEFFPIQIGREMLAHRDLLDCADRIDWKRCTSSAEQAKELTRSIRNSFKQFDFTL